MSTLALADAQSWAAQTFGAARLGDPRRTRRVVAVAAALRRQPGASLPQQLGTPGALKGAYGVLHAPGVTHAALLAPAAAATRTAASAYPLVLFPGDLTILDYSHHPTTTGLGRVGNGRGRGYVVHSVLAVLPDPRQVLGLAHQIPLVHGAPVPDETLRQRQARRREPDLWQEAVEAIGAPPAGAHWVHVGDRGADLFRFLAACRRMGCDFLVRAWQDRRVEGPGESSRYLRQMTCAWTATATDTVQLPAGHGNPARTATLALRWEAVVLQEPRQEPGDGPLPATVIRVWEPDPPADTEPIAWLLVTSVPVTSVADAWERVRWYLRRWTIEDFHQCLKTGCQIEQRLLRDQPALERLLALCSPIAVWLLQMRDAARLTPDQPATAVIDSAVVALVAQMSGQRTTMTVQQFWHAVARRGGWLGRRGDGPPGWKTLWRGWHDIDLLLEGVRLARAHNPPMTSG